MTDKTQVADAESEPKPGSLLGNLAQIHKKIEDEMTLALEVPKWREEGLPVFVRYRPLSHERIRRAMDKIDAAKNTKNAGKIEMEQNIDLLLDACDAVYAEVDGERKSLSEKSGPGEFTRFDEDLGDALGLPSGGRTARWICRKLFFTDGDVLGHAGRVGEFSGYSSDRVSEDFEGK